jgi:hypothetical protein
MVAAAGSNQTPSVRTTATAFSLDAATNVLTVTATSARYADLAESYAADKLYQPGTVMIFGGSAEITQSLQAVDPSVAGVVTSDPAHLMNAFQIGEYIVNVALVGRVPCKVVGIVRKGDRLVTSHIPGVAMVMPDGPQLPGVLIGKALQNYDSDVPGVIEVAVGRS